MTDLMGKDAKNINALSAVTNSTAATATMLNMSLISDISMNLDIDETNINVEALDQSVVVVYQNNNALNARYVSNMSSVLMSRSLEESHFECPPNAQKKLYDEAVEELEGFCKDIDLKSLTSIKYHANSWGLSSNNYFADDVISKMSNLRKIDFSDTIHY